MPINCTFRSMTINYISKNGKLLKTHEFSSNNFSDGICYALDVIEENPRIDTFTIIHKDQIRTYSKDGKFLN